MENKSIELQTSQISYEFLDRYQVNILLYANASLHDIPMFAYDERHLDEINLLSPLLATPWLIGTLLFMQTWTPDLIVLNTDVNVRNYEIIINNYEIKCCKYHYRIIKSIYELIKEITAIKNVFYFNSIPTWLGLIINDIITYHIHVICVDECLELVNKETLNKSRKQFLINREEKILKLILTCKNFNLWNSMKDVNIIYKNYSAINLLFNLVQTHLKYGELEELLEKFKEAYTEYIASLRTKLWAVTYVDNNGIPQVHKNKGRIPNFNLSKYNLILYFAK